MEHFLLYWLPDTVAKSPTDMVQWWAGSNQIDERVHPGDVVWAVTAQTKDDLRLVARIPVERVVHTRQEAVALVGENAWKDADHFAIGREEDCRPKQDIDLSDVARRLMFDGKPERLPAGFDGKNLQSMRRLTATSAGVLQRAWDDGEASKPPRFVWQRDELILALDLYLRLDRTVADESHPEVIALSALLGELPIHTDRNLDPTFRNPNGVALKLANFRALDQPGKGMTRGNKLEQVVWDQFVNDPVHLRQTAGLIASGYRSDAAQEQMAPQEEEEGFMEGRIAYRLHRSRERSRELVRRKKLQGRDVAGRLRCEACQFDFEAVYGDVGKDFIECHHTIPVSTLPEGARTKLEDVVLVCSNCHRMIHRSREWLTVAQVRSMLFQPATAP